VLSKGFPIKSPLVSSAFGGFSEDELNNTRMEVYRLPDQILQQFCEYSKYLYESEIARMQRLNVATKNYLLFILATITISLGAIQWLKPNIEKEHFAFDVMTYQVALVCIALVFFFVALVCSVLVLRVRPYERLCDPEEFARVIVSETHVDGVIEAIAANYVVATNRNYYVNHSKAKWLARSLNIYLCGLMLLLVSGILYSVLH